MEPIRFLVHPFLIVPEGEIADELRKQLSPLCDENLFHFFFLIIKPATFFNDIIADIAIKPIAANRDFSIEKS